MLTLLATSGVSLIIGFGYWKIAARLFSQEQVGYGTAAVSAMTLLSSFGTFGLNTLLVGDLPKRRDHRAGFIAAAMISAALGSLLLAIGFIAVVPHFTTHYNDVAQSVGGSAVFCVGVALSSASIVFDAATIGMLRGGLQLTRNMVFVFTKMLMLIGVAIVLHYTFGIGIFASWVAALPVSLLVVAVRLWIGGNLRLPRPDWNFLRSRRRALAAHNWLNLSLQIPVLLIPVAAATMFAPSTNAAYYIALTITNGLFILPSNMSTVLFALGAADPRILPQKLRFALRVTLLVGLAGMAVLGFGAHFILEIFGVGYAQVAVLPMRIMVLTYLPSVPNFLYVSVARAKNKLSQAAAVVTGLSVLDIAGVVIGGLTHGAVGMAAGDFTVVTLGALLTTPVVLRSAIGQGRHRRTVVADMSAPASAQADDAEKLARRDITWRSAAEREQQQLESLAVLMAMATPTTASMRAITSENGPWARPPRSDSRPSRQGGRDMKSHRSA